jgi:hypothetical protein
MPNFLTTGDVLEIKEYITDAEQVAVNTFHYRVTALVGSIDDGQVGDAWNTGPGAAYPALLYDGATVIGVSVRILDHVPKLAANLIPNPTAGTGGTVGCPRQSCPLLKYKTGDGGSRGRGRTYLPFMPSAGLATLGECSPAYIISMAVLLSALEAFNSVAGVGPSVATIRQVIYHRDTHTATDVDEWAITPKIATQKRRGSFGRPNISPF